MWGIPMEIQPRAIKVNFALAKQPGFCTQLFALTPPAPERIRAHLTASTEDGSGAHNPAQTFPKPAAPPLQVAMPPPGMVPAQPPQPWGCRVSFHPAELGLSGAF